MRTSLGQQLGRRWASRTVLIGVSALALLFAACSSTTGPVGTATPGGVTRGLWTRPVLPGLATPTVSAVAFADADQHIGYMCSATVRPSGTGTPFPETPIPGTPNLTPQPTPTLNIPGRPTPPSTQDITNAFWNTHDGGQSWAAATLPNDPDLICPISGIVAPDLANPADLFLLAGHGAVNLTNPTSVLPSQLTFRLWRSQDAGQTWQALRLPTVPNPIQPVVLAPYHLIIQVHGTRLIFATNYSGANALFTSDDQGQTWQSRGTESLASAKATSPLNTFAGFAAGPGNTLLALTTNTVQGASPSPFQVWQSSDGADTWVPLGAPALNLKAGATVHAQLFTAPGGTVAYLLAQATAVDGTSQLAVQRSTDGGNHWSALGWPSNPNANGAPFGGANIALLGTNFTVDAQGTAYVAPSINDLTAAQDPQGPLSAGFFAARVSSPAWVKVVAPFAPTNTALQLAVSLMPAGTLGTPGTNTVTPVLSVTPSVSPAPSSSVTPETTPSATPTVDGLPTLWTNFGPLTQFAAHPETAGLFGNVLP